jgi:hypothetical protein
MLAARWLEVPITWSLVIVGAILAICAVASALAGKESQRKENREEGTG